jgi:zinc transporter 7
VIPELLIDTKFWQSVKEIIAILAGVYMMVLVAQLE